MDKPITVARKEFIDKLVELINGSGLPAFILADVLAGCMKEVSELADKQYQADLKAYKESEEKEAEE